MYSNYLIVNVFKYWRPLICCQGIIKLNNTFINILFNHKSTLTVIQFGQGKQLKFNFNLHLVSYVQLNSISFLV